MTNLLLLGLCFALGFLGRRSALMPADTARVLNGWIIYVSLPALVLRVVHEAPLVPTVGLSAACLWGVFVVPAALAWLARARGMDAGTLGAMALGAGLGNTAFVGLPLLEVLGGAQAVEAGALVDQLGTFVAFSVLAVPFAMAMGGRTPSPGAMVERALRFPPLLALVAALLLRDLPFPAAVTGTLARLGDMLSPLALASVGWQLNLALLKGEGARLATGLAWKLALAPAAVLGVLLAFGGGELGLLQRVTVVQAGMAPMVTGGVLAAEHRLAPHLGAGFVGLGVPLSFATAPLWWWITGWFSA